MRRTLAVLVLVAVVFYPLTPPLPIGAQEAAVGKKAKKKQKRKDRRPFVPWSELEKVPTTTEWFEVYLLRPGLMAIYEPRHPQKTISYLVLGEERALLFDTGLGIGDLASLVAELTPLDVVVLNSHTHGDHIGGNHQFPTIYGTDTEYTRINARGKLETDAEAGTSGEPHYRIRPFDVHKEVRDGQVIDLGGRRLELLLTPGHAPDALCLADRDNRLLFTGDTFYLGQLYAHLEHSDLNLYRKTAFRLSSWARKVDVLLPAHLVTLVRSDYLRRLNLGFRSIFDSTARQLPSQRPGVVLYRYEDFSILVRERDARRFALPSEPPPPTPPVR